MAVIHILKDGTKVPDITGYQVMSKEIYTLIDEMNKRRKQHGHLGTDPKGK